MWKCGATETCVERGNNINKKWLLPVCLLLVFGLVVMRPKSMQRRISEEIGIDVSHAEVLLEMDTHGGFHGDGTSCVVFQLDEETAQTLRCAQEWKQLPMHETAQTLLYGVTHTTPEGTWTAGPYLRDADEKPLVPHLQSGYYLLLDRHSSAKPNQDAAEILRRASINVTIAVYDDTSHILYVCRLDT